MQYLISFLEGIITFISPCLLPMLPIYISYFAGGGQRSTIKTVTTASGFVLGFTFVFILMGALASNIGSFFRTYQTIIDFCSGIVVVFFGLQYLGVFRVVLFRGSRRSIESNMEFGSAVLFGIIFSISWTPCVGVFLGSALMLASQQGSMTVGMLMLFCYSMGLGIPFLLSAVLIEQMKNTLEWIKQHYQIINYISGCLLVIIGTAMATGMMGDLLRWLS